MTTQRKVDELLQPLFRLEALAQANPDGVMLLAGQEVLFANPAAKALLPDLQAGQSPLARTLLLATAANRRTGQPERAHVQVGSRHLDVCVHSAGEYQQVTMREQPTPAEYPEAVGHTVSNLLTGMLGLTVLLEANLAGGKGETAELLAELRRTVQAGVALIRPAPTGEDANGTRPWTPARVGQGESILFVDDEQSLRLVGKASLSRAGYRVFTARNGQDAVAYFKRHAREIRLVLLDLDMPVMDGEACFAALQEVDPGVRAVVMSGHAGSPAVERMLKAGALAFLSKPFDVSQLLAITASWLGGVGV